MASYAPPGELGGMMYGQATGFSGISNAAAYNSRLELTSATASSSAGSAQSLGFNYNLPAGNNGTVSSIQNSVTSGLSQSFTYDSLDRILSGATTATSGTGCWGQSFGPSGNPPAGPPEDFWGNLSQINGTQCATGTLSVVINTTTNRIATSGFSYDSSGDMTADGSGYAYTFDAENHLTQASGTPSGTWTYVYDGNGLRVEKTNGTNGTLYWRDLSGNTIAETDLTGSTTDSAYREYIFFAGGRVAQRDAATPTPNVYFYYTDQVGSIGTITKANGTPCYQATFTPYGQEMATQTACASNYKFTGYERDAETGLDYAFARYYNQRLGRFMSADPLGGDITDPQSLNRYAYVTNSPTNFSDPSGMNKCAYQGTMTFSSGSAGCTGGGGTTNSNMWDNTWADMIYGPADIADWVSGMSGSTNVEIDFSGGTTISWFALYSWESIGAFNPGFGPMGVNYFGQEIEAAGRRAPQAPTPQTPISPQLQKCMASANASVQSQLQTFSGYAGTKLLGRALIGGGIGAISSLGRYMKTDNPWAIATGALIGGLAGAGQNMYSDSQTIQRIQNSFMDKVGACMDAAPPPPQ
ncbi:MAG: RHS repeat-associated core domain-containing protein [Candidatus Acidiferrales bacterium]